MQQKRWGWFQRKLMQLKNVQSNRRETCNVAMQHTDHWKIGLLQMEVRDLVKVWNRNQHGFQNQNQHALHPGGAPE
jgi:hypothetical protein